MNHSDRPDPDSVLLADGSAAATVNQLLAELDSLGIEHHTIEHEPLYTVEQARKVKYGLDGAHTKNLFLRNKKGRMFLMVVSPERTVDLKGLRDKLGLTGGQFAFASTERLAHYLGVVPGSVSPLALINDKSNKVALYIEASLLTHEFIYLHPCRNTHSTRIKTDDLVKAVTAWNHPPEVLHFE